MEWVAELIKGATREDLETLCVLLSPFAPHMAEACWERLGKGPFACTQPWPAFDAKLVIGETITVAVQVNGKLRATFEAERGASEETLKTAALALPAVQKHLGDKTPKKVIVARGSLVNVVV